MDEMNLKISSSPHVRSKDTTSDIMYDVIIALVPAAVIGIYQFGWYSALLIAVCMITSVLAELIYQRGMKLKVTVGDCSAALTGLLIALNLPPTFPVWMAMLGCVFAIIVIKQLFGGLGQNFMNPALGARCFLLLAFSKYMTNFVYDGVSTATPLAVLKAGGKVDILDMFIGRTAGTIGEISAAALLVGAIYLLIKRVITPRIPLVYIGTFTICIVIYAVVKDKNVVNFTLAHLCGGGLMLGAWFMATDYVTSPVTPKGKLVYGVILGLLTFVLRIFGNSAEGVSYAIIISNLLVPLIEKVTVPKCFGQGAETKGETKKSKKAEAKNEEADDETRTEKKQPTDKAEKNTEQSGAKKSFNIKGIVIAIAALFVITVVMGAALGVVHGITEKPIAEANEKAKTEAYKAVFPEATDITTLKDDELNYDAIEKLLDEIGFPSNRLEEFSIASDEDSIHGFILVMTNSDGYGGDIKLVVGIRMDGTVSGISFLELNETVGLGMEADTEEFKQQFVDNGIGNFTYTKTGASNVGEIDALSGATITTSAVVDAVNAALNICYLLVGGGN